MASERLQHPYWHKHKYHPMVSQIAKRANEIWRRMGKPKGKYSRSWRKAEAEFGKLFPHRANQLSDSSTA